nr:MAG TPA: ATP dependent DNA helicase [Caudoviricetes sp.]
MKVGEEVKFKCVPVTERYYNDDSSYGVFVFHTRDEIPEYDEVPDSPFESIESTSGKRMSILAGNMQQLYIGSEYEVTATLDYNSKYKSYQYKPKIVTSITPKTEEQQKKFLQSIVTKNQAETLLAKYPNIVEDIISGNDNVDTRCLKGIGDKTYDSIKKKVIDNYVISDILTLLQPLGVTYAKIKKLLSNEPNPTLLKEKLLSNPYIMLNIKGFGFKTVDQLALKLNPGIKCSAKRTYAFVKYYLKDIGNNQGHTWVDIDALENAVIDNINECTDIFKSIIENEKNKEINLHFYYNKVGLMEYYESERNVFEQLKRLNNTTPLKITEEDIRIGIEQSEKDQGFTLTEEQKELVKNSIKSNVVIVVGFAGVGKTCVSRAILNVYKHAKYSIACCALSAMAGQRITEATGFEASTIHRLLGYSPNGFAFNSDVPLQQDVIFVDECSMINSYLFESIVSAIQTGKKIIMCGDNRQLPPIGYGNIFGDLLEKTDDFSIFKLTKVLRQAEKSGILMDANKIREGKFPIKQPELKIINGELQDMTYMFRDSRESLSSIAIKTYMKVVEKDGLDNVVIITPRRENCENSANEMNKKIVNLIADKTQKYMRIGDKTFYVGSKVMQTDNNYDKNVFNGEIGYIRDIKTEYDGNEKTTVFNVEYKMNGKSKVVKYNRNELGQIDLAYAMTVHKVQGQSIKSVIIITDMTHYTLLDTCLLYTAITRAKERCLLLSEPMAFKICMENNKSRNRQTWLSLM